MSDTMTLPNPTTFSIPTNYAIAGRPAHQRTGTPIPARIIADIEATMRSGQALAWPVEGYDDKQVARLAARLNAIGRRGGRDFAVRTRKSDEKLFAWAVPRVLRAKRGKAAVSGEASPEPAPV